MDTLIVDTNFVMNKVGKTGWVIVDVRFPGDYAKAHIPGAVGLPAWKVVQISRPLSCWPIII